jgi:hypothetical protein
MVGMIENGAVNGGNAHLIAVVARRLGAGLEVRGPQGVLLDNRVIEEFLDDGSYVACAQAAIQCISRPVSTYASPVVPSM